MKKFVVEDEFWNVFPNAKIGVIVAHGIDNSIKDITKYEEIISQAEEEALKHLQNQNFSHDKHM